MLDYILGWLLNWFCQYRDAVAATLIVVGGFLNIAGVVAKLGFIAFSIGGALIAIGLVFLFFIPCP